MYSNINNPFNSISTKLHNPIRLFNLNFNSRNVSSAAYAETNLISMLTCCCERKTAFEGKKRVNSSTEHLFNFVSILFLEAFLLGIHKFYLCNDIAES